MIVMGVAEHDDFERAELLVVLQDFQLIALSRSQDRPSGTASSFDTRTYVLPVKKRLSKLVTTAWTRCDSACSFARKRYCGALPRRFLVKRSKLLRKPASWMAAAVCRSAATASRR